MISAVCPHCKAYRDFPDDCIGVAYLCERCRRGYMVIDSAGRTMPLLQEGSNQDAPPLARSEIKVVKCSQCHAEFHAVPNVKFCPECGTALNLAHSASADKPEMEFSDIKSKTDEVLRNAFSFEKIENFSFSSFMCQVFKRHSWEEIEDYLSNGTPAQTPDILSISTVWPAPWLFFRMLLVTVLGVLFLYWQMDFFGPGLIVMPLMLLGVIGIPLATLMFFWELNLPRNISVLLLIRLMLISGFISVAITFFIHNLIKIDLGVIAAGPIEEIAKALTMLIFWRNRRYCYKLNGLLIGAAVGAGFAIIETGGYILGAGQAADITMIIRALASPFGHIAYSAIVGGAMWRLGLAAHLRIANLIDRKFLTLFAIAVGLHMFWNSSFIITDFLLKAAIVGAIEYTLIIYLIQEGINEIRQLKDDKINEMQNVF